VEYAALENTYTKNDNVIFVLAPQSGNVFAPEVLLAVEELTNEAWKLPYSSRVDSLTNFQHTRAEEDDLIVEDLVIDAASLTAEDISRIKEIALAEPLLVNRIVSPKAHVTGINVNCVLPGADLNESHQVHEKATALAKLIEEKHPGITLYTTGGVMIDNAFGEASEQDMKTLIPLMFLVLLLVMFIALRSFTGTMTTFAVILFSVITGMGLAGWLGIILTPPSANAPTIILTLAVADSIHILATVFQQMRMGLSRKEAITESLRINLQPIFVTSITTAIGFLAMNFSDAPPFRDLGNIVAMGIIAAFFYSILFLPAIMAVLPIRIKPRDSELNAYEKFGEFVVAKRTPIFWTMFIFIVLVTSGMSKITLDDDFVRYFDDRFDFRVASDYCEDNLTGMSIIDWDLNSGEDGGINNPEYLKTVEDFANWFRTKDYVRHVYSLTDVMKQLNRSMHGDDESWYRLPDNRQLAAQYLLLYEMSLPFGLDLNDRLNVDKSASRLTVNLANITSSQLRILEEEGRQWLADNAPEHMYAYGSGLSVVFSHISERNIKSMLSASVLALILISGILIIVLRSFKLGFLSLLPNLAPAFMGFGLWGILVGRVGLAVSVLIAMTIGIVVDDTVHFLSKYRRARTEHDLDPRQAVVFSFKTVGAPIMMTTIILACGFSVLAFSGFKINSDMGTMTAITIVFALILDFLFLPAVLIKLEERK